MTVGQLRELLSECDDEAEISVEIYVPDVEYVSLKDELQIDSEGDVTLFASDVLG